MDQQAARHLMVDFETLGVSRDSVILSVGMCVFDMTGEIHENIYMEFSVVTQISEGRTVDNNTVAWWIKTNQPELKRLLHRSPLAVCSTDKIAEVIEGLDVKYVWSRGYMDFEILNSFIQLPYWSWRDVRTLDVFGMKMPKNNHNALDDCKNQVKYVTEVIRKCKSNVLTAGQVDTPIAQSVPTATKESSS